MRTAATALLTLGLIPLSPAVAEGPVVPDALRLACGDCHADGAAEGGFSLDDLAAGQHGDKTAAHWASAWRNLRAETMPPPDAEPPADRAALLRWIETDVFGVDAARPHAGHVAARRLNRTEYRNTVADLLGVDFDTDEEFPVDDSSYGFDTVGDSLRMTPALLEKYLDAAEVIAAKAVPLDGPLPPADSFWGGSFGGPDGSAEKMPLDRPAKAFSSREVPAAGEYRLEITYKVHDSWTQLPTTADFVIRAIPEGGSPAELVRRTVGWDDRGGRVAANLTLPAGKVTFECEVVPGVPHRRSDLPDVDEDLRYALGLDACTLIGPMSAPAVYRYPATKVFTRGVPPEDADGRRAFVRTTIEDVAARAFRRPPTPQEADALAALAIETMEAPGGSLERGVREAVTRILGMPQFLYRAESAPQAGVDASAGSVPIDEFALASRLSYFLWAGPPDGGLYWAAKEGTLRRDLDEHVNRMLNDPWRTPRFVKAFVGQWLRTRDLEDHVTDVRRVLRFRDPRIKPIQRKSWQIRDAMRQETELLFAHLVAEGRPVSELLSADYTFLNETLAEFYGIEGVTGREMRKVPLPEGSRRGGLLSHGSFLTVTSNPTRTSPVNRGLFILENLLGTPPPPAPPNIPAFEDAGEGLPEDATTRAILARHREDESCASCHNRMDPLGLALENYDALGLWRDIEKGMPGWKGRPSEPDRPIDPAGRLITGEKFGDAAELADILATRRQRDVLRCLTEKMLTYAVGREITVHDSPTVEAIIAAVEADGGSARTLVREVIRSAPFQRTDAPPGGVAIAD